jgi:tetratricopeptide (TPR) repeat protein
MKIKLAVIAILLLLLVKLPALLPNITDSYLQEEKGNFNTALDIMLELQSAEPNEPFYQVRVAWLQYLLGRYEDAILTYRKAIKLQDNLDAQLGIVNCQLALGKYQEAIGLVDELLKEHAQNPTLMSKGAYAAYMKKDYARAVSYYQMLIGIYPWDMESRGYLVNNLFLSGQEEEGKRQLSLLKKYYPQSAIINLYSSKLK